MQYKQGILPLIFGISLLHVFTISDAYAYIDPGTGSLVIQVIVGVLVGTGITVKIYWYKIKEKISHINKKDE